jgi:glycosyltransferase involved in cell wall biosynthesis
MSIVFDNILFSLQKNGGGSRFWSNIIKPHISRSDAIFLECIGSTDNTYRKHITIPTTRRDRALPLILSRYLNFNHDFFGKKNFIFHSSYFRVNKSPRCINITTVHDMIYEKFLDDFSSKIHIRQKQIALEHSDVIVCVSENTKMDLLKFYPFCSKKKLLVIPNGVNSKSFDSLNVVENNKRNKPYFLYIGHRSYLKGFSLVYNTLEALKDDIDCIVVGDSFSEIELNTILKRGLTNRIINVGRISDSELLKYYSGASFFFFPSFYEGFGIPPLEAMAANCPVLASNRSSIPEVVGDAALLFDPDNTDSLNHALLEIQKEDVKNKLIKNGRERIKNFTWERSASEYSELYRNLIR